MAVTRGNRVGDTHLVTLTATVGRKKIAQLDGTLAGAGEYGFPSLEDGVSGEKIAVQLSGVAVLIAGSAGVTAAGDAVESDASGLAISFSAGLKIGRALNAAASGEEVQVVLGYN
jgi:hypothetical protein